MRCLPHRWRFLSETMASSRLFAAIALLLLLMSPALAAQNDASCLSCHGDTTLFVSRDDPGRFVVDPDPYGASVHAAAGLSCSMCHQGYDSFPHSAGAAPAACSQCHSAIGEQFSSSLHGYALSRGNPRAPSCTTCHGTHNVLPGSDPESPIHKARLQSTCASCHGTAGLLTDQIVKLPQSFTGYAESVHGVGAERGIATAASCADCHSVHNLRGAADPESRINPMNVASTCGQCHPDISGEYSRSIHGRALAAGVTDSPTCTGCHGEHLILSPSDPRARTYAANQATGTCGPCHDDPIIIAKYNLQPEVVATYVDSYHGWATQLGHGTAAACVDCHTDHSVLPEADSASSIHATNLVATCAQCHENADRRFAESYTHEDASITKNPINRWIRNIYVVLIALIIGAMIVHNLVIMNYFMIQRRLQIESSEWIVRFDRSEIVQHLLVTISFVVLAVTGFALRFPDAWWVQSLRTMGMTEPVRSTLHRIFAVVLIAVALSHMYYVFFTRRGKAEFRSIVPRRRDVRDFLRNMRFYTWRSKESVKFGRYDYSQKAEYWALIWGTIMMIITGFVLWFPEQAVKVFPAWIVTASQTVHYYEAWLAVLAIVVWHFFFVIFHPEEYPMSWTWLTGRMSLSEVKRHHERWYEEDIRPARQGEGELDTDAESAPKTTHSYRNHE